MRRSRIAILLTLTLVVTGLLGLRAAQIGVLQANELTERASAQQQTVRPLVAPRGKILDRTGQPLATDRPAVDVIATPYLIEDKPAAARQLAEILLISQTALSAQLAKTGGYVPLLRGGTPEQGEKVRALGINGISVEPTLLREQPGGASAAQVVGLIDEKRRGTVGLEDTTDARLHGSNGTVRIVRDGRGEIVHQDTLTPARPGHDVQTTIDAALQQWVAQAVDRTRERTGANAVSAMVMDPRDGEILAVATSPGFDPNDRTELDVASMRLRAFTDQYEPGSTFKILAVAQALEKRAVTPDTVFDLPARLARYDRVLRDAEERGDMAAPVRDILAHSSNIGTVLIADRLGNRNMQNAIERFGFGRETAAEFPGEQPGYVLPLSQWSGSSSLNIPIGQGISVTLAQMVRAYGVIANGGRLVEPHMIRQADPLPHSQVISRRTAAQMRAMLEGVIDEGTGKKADLPGYSVAGKTGTANKVKNGVYTDSYASSFIGFVPARAPKFVIAVLVDEPQNGYYGGDVAAPAFADIARFALSRAGVGQDRERP